MRLPRPLDGPQRPHTLLSEASPYGSGYLIVESDSAVSAAYLLDHDGHVRSSLWLANHGPAPAQTDHERSRAGLFPRMPAAHTKHGDGRVGPRRGSLEAVWFEEGDSAAIRENGALLGVLPGPSGPDGQGGQGGQGAPGYTRDALGRTPLGWALDEAHAILDPRVDRARQFWRWHSGKDGWGQFQRAVLGHLEQRLGEGGRYWSADGDRLPRVGVIEHPATAQRPFAVYSTVGMSCQRLPRVREHAQPAPGRIELALAVARPTEASVDVLSWLGPYPWRHRAWFGPGHVAAWDTGAALFPLGDQWAGALMLANPAVLLGPRPPDLSGFTVHGEAVQWLWLLPVTRKEQGVAGQYGPAALVDELALQGSDWLTQL